MASQPNITQIPAPRVEFIDPRTGLMAREWYRFFLNLFTLTGSGTSTISLTDVQVAPPPQDQASIKNELQSLEVGPPVIGVDAQLATLKSAVEGLYLTPTPPETQRLYYGAFHDTTNQSAAAINTAYAMTFNSTDFTFGTQRGSTTSQIIVNNPGTYNVQFSAQLSSGSASSKVVSIWLRINGVDVANSATNITMQGSSGKFVAAWNFMLQMKATDYFELMWSTTDTNVILEALAAAAPIPGVPSVILTVSQVNLT